MNRSRGRKELREKGRAAENFDSEIMKFFEREDLASEKFLRGVIDEKSSNENGANSFQDGCCALI